MSAVDERIERLEQAVAHLERQLDDMSDQLVELFDRADGQDRQVKRLANRLQTLEEAAREAAAGGDPT